MSSVINFFKRKIKPFKKCGEKSTICIADQTTKDSVDLTSASLVSLPKRVALQNGIKKRTRNVFNLKLKKTTNPNRIQQCITSEIVVVSNEYPSSPLVNSTKTDQAIPNDMSSYSNQVTLLSNDWSITSQNLLNASSKNYFFNEAESNLTEFSNSNNDDNVSMLTYKSGCNAGDKTPPQSTNSSDEPRINYSFSRSKVIKRKSSSNKRAQPTTNLDRSLSINDLNEESSESLTRANTNQVSKRKCRRSNTTVAANGSSKSNSIIDYFNKLDLINPVRKRELTALSHTSEMLEKHVEKIVKIDEAEQMSDDLASNTSKSKNEIEKIQDLFFDDSDISETDEYAQNFKQQKEKIVISSYLDSPVSSSGMSPTSLDAETKTSEDFFHVPSSSPAFETPSNNNESKLSSNINNQSIEKLRRSISTPGLKDINASIFSNISHIQIKDCYELNETDLNNNNKEAELSEKSIEVNESLEPKAPQFIRGGATRSSKNIKQLFKNVVKYQMNALNSLEKFYETQMNKLEADRKRNLKLNPRFADKINEFYDRQLSLLEERVQANLTLICDSKRNRLSTASSSSTIQQNNINKTAAQSVFMKSNDFVKKNADSDKMAKIVTFNHFKQTQTETSLPSRQQMNQQTKINVNSRTLNDLKLNLKNQNNLLPSKSNYNKMGSSLNDTSAFDSPKLCKENDSEKFSIAKYRSPKQVVPSISNQFYKKQSILQSPMTNIGNNSIVLKIETPQKEQPKTQFQYQKNKIKRYSTSNENLAQITKVHHVRNNMARIVRLNKTDQQQRQFKKHQSVCSLDSNEIEIDEEDEKEVNGKSIVSIKNEYNMRHGVEEFKSVNTHDVLGYFEMNNNLQSRLSDSHLWYELRQQQQIQQRQQQVLYHKKNCKSVLIETKV